jgi:AraC-like DNA-binding protein
MGSDLLSDVLTLVRLTGALLFEVEIKGPCGVASCPTLEKFAPMLPPGTTQVIAFHVVLEGQCWVRQGAGRWAVLPAGHAVILPHGGLHEVCDRPGRMTAPFETMLGGKALPDLRRVSVGRPGGEPLRLLCGFLGCDRRAFDPLCRSLPLMFDVDLGERMETLVRYATDNALDDSPGAAGLRGRFAELLFVSALRIHMCSLPADATGWLAGLRDPLVGRALQAMHERPCHRWSVEELAGCAATSRSVLAERFRAIIGEPPMHYLTRLRMQVAGRRLVESRQSIAQVADEIGYDSSAAFQRAFKRCFGTPPATWRRTAAVGR